MRSAGALCFVVALLAGCAASPTSVQAGDPEAGRVSGHAVSLRIVRPQGVVSLRAEIAATGPTRALGLMERTALAADAGMLFVYPEPQGADAGFWMYRTRIPLDIAFLDRDGRIVAIRSMAPCESAAALKCPTYAPGVPYHAALEVNRGFFARNGIAVGDRVLPPSGVSFREAAE